MAKDQCTTQAHSNVVLTDPTNTIDVSSEFWRWESFGVTEGKQLSTMRYSNGTPAMRPEQNYQDLIVVGGAARVYPSWNFLTDWWPRLMHGGALTNNDNYSCGSTIAQWFATKYDGVKTRLLNDLCVAQFTLAGSEGGPIMLDIDVIGSTGEDDVLPGTLPAQGEAALDDRLLFSGSTFLYGGESYSIDSFSVTVNHLVTPKFWNSTSAQCFQSQGRVVTVTLGLAWNSDTATDFHGQGDAGADLTMRLQSGTASFYDELLLNKVKWPDIDPPVLFEGDMPYSISGQAHESGTPGSIVDDFRIVHYDDEA